MTALAPPVPAAPRLGMLARLGDEALAGRAAAGNTAAFSALYERYHGPLLGYCRSILLNDEDANDAVQNALENALRSLARREPGRPLKPWLYRIAHNESINIVRRRPAHAELTELDEPSVPGPEVASEHRVRLAQLVDDLRGLPERQRGALVMRELSGLSYDDIAIALGVSNEAARRAVFDARSALHEAVDGRATECVSVRHCISDGDRRRLRGRGIRAHLRSCDDCASFQRSIGARSADLHLLGPWLSGAAIASMIGGGAGGGALIAAGGGATVSSVAGWSSMPVFLKGATVAAVVATAGGAAAEIKHVAKPDNPAPQTQAAARRTVAASSPTAPALRRVAPAATTRSPRATATSGRGGLRSGSSTPKRVVERAENVATPQAPAVAPTPPPAAPAQQQSQPQQEQVATPKAPVKTAISQLTNIREQVMDVVQQAQALAASGTAGALQAANGLLDSTLGAVRPTLDRILAMVGLSLPETTAAPATSTAAAAPSVPSTVLQPVQSVLDGVDSVLSKLLGRTAG
ncbi:MAG TPA: RNA polymerase sigma factor [Solirubrobacteraceae bacterium]|nr:RNA polymerase sigma factor [Solirubrobacteraceae bacterium]